MNFIIIFLQNLKKRVSEPLYGEYKKLLLVVELQNYMNKQMNEY